MENKIYVTAPTLAPLNEVVELLEGVWESGVLTHNGPLVQRLETDLANKLDVENLRLVTNGTIAIQLALKALKLKGEVITTPFTWIATLSAIQWEDCTPVFCDIDPKTLNIDVAKIEACITDQTVAILPVHVFGNPCDVHGIDKIAKKHGLEVIYDAAHALGSTVNSESIFKFGSISATSLHATKLFNTGEGGALITNSAEIDREIEQLRFFGYNREKEVVGPGTNGKMSEIHAALGLANLNLFDEVLLDRKKKYKYYLEALSTVSNLSFQKLEIGESNYSYFPIIFEDEISLLSALEKLSANQIHARRYFYPSVNSFNKLGDFGSCPVSESITTKILCLPLYFDLSYKHIDRIIKIIKDDLLK
jgi:dTDP-4-amino-4,6-dideoxygalactose transaminase